MSDQLPVTGSAPLIRVGIEDLLREAGWTIPEGYQARDSGHCRSCGAEVLWCTTKADRIAPLDRDGISHFATCKDAAAWRKKR